MITKLKILIVEHNKAHQLLYQIEIQDMGYQVILAKDGFEAIDKIKSQEPDLIVLDSNMKNMPGLDRLREFVNIFSAIPVIIHTTYTYDNNNFMNWAAEACIIKSSDLSELKKAIGQSLSNSYIKTDMIF